MAFVPAMDSEYLRSVALSLAMWIALTESWLLLSGLSGYLSLGHAVFYGIGAYVGVLLWGHVPLWLAVMIGGAVGGACALLVGFPVLRVRGPYFVMLTFGLAELVKYLVTWIEAGLGQYGRIVVGPPSLNTLFYFMLAFAIAATCLTHLVSHSRVGYALRAIRENEEAAETAGVPVVYYKIFAFVASAIIPSMVGVVMMMRTTFFEPAAAFDPVVSFTIVTMAMIGGRDNASGPLVGAIFLAIVSELLWANWPQVYMIVLGALLVSFVLFARDGLVGLFLQKRKAGAT
jgi:branched-chain amino acid transport system permease protein